MDWLLQLWPLLYVLMCYTVSAGFDGVYIHSIGVHIDCCILRRRNWELYDQRFGWLCYKKCDCHKNSKCLNYLESFILMRIEFKLSYCLPDPSSVSSKHGNFHVWRYVSTHENWSGFDLEFCIVAVHDYQIKKTSQELRKKFSKKWNIIGTCNIADVGIVWGIVSTQLLGHEEIPRSHWYKF